MTTTLILSFIISFVVTTVVAAVLVPYLRKIKAGQSIKKDGPTWHMSKQGTPTMGGLAFIAGIVGSCFSIGLLCIKNGQYEHIFMLGFSLIFAVIGFLDDYEKLKKKENTGLTALQKFALQLAAAVAFILLLRYFGIVRPNLYIPFLDITILMREDLYLILAAFIIVGTVNAVNITDGIDGLVTGVTLPVAACYAAIAFSWGYMAQGIFAAALTGGLAGFLIYNFYPAKVFMGDTGSLFLGGAVCALAFSLDMPLILIPLGIVYIVETMSDIIQIIYFKVTHGKRIFKMAPLHHHLEMCGWKEKKIFAVFTAITFVMAVVVWSAVHGRYGA